MKRATSVARDQLVSLGVCVGKFTHSDKFRLTIGALELLAAHAKHKVRIATGEADASRSFAKVVFSAVCSSDASRSFLAPMFFLRLRALLFVSSPGDASHFSLQPEPL